MVTCAWYRTQGPNVNNRIFFFTKEYGERERRRLHGVERKDCLGEMREHDFSPSASLYLIYYAL